METTKFTADGWYVVKLPWKVDHPPLSTNLDIAERRLRSTLARLGKVSLFDDYSAIFCGWLLTGIVEKFRIVRLNDPITI